MASSCRSGLSPFLFFRYQNVVTSHISFHSDSKNETHKSKIDGSPSFCISTCAYHSCKKSCWSDDGNRLIEPSNTATYFFCDNYVSFRWLLLIWVIWNDEQCIDAWWVLFCIIRGSHERHHTDTREDPLSFVLNSHFVSPNNLLSWNLLSLVLRLFILIMILPAIFTLL